MMLRKLIDNGIGVDFSFNDKQYKVAKDLELETYYIISYIGEIYNDKELWNYEVEDTGYWEEIESYIERLVEEVE